MIQCLKRELSFKEVAFLVIVVVIAQIRITIIKSKSKGVPSLFLTEHYAMKVYWGVEV
jgi:hypothetical protein